LGKSLVGWNHAETRGQCQDAPIRGSSQVGRTRGTTRRASTAVGGEGRVARRTRGQVTRKGTGADPKSRSGARRFSALEIPGITDKVLERRRPLPPSGRPRSHQCLPPYLLNRCSRFRDCDRGGESIIDRRQRDDSLPDKTRRAGRAIVRLYFPSPPHRRRWAQPRGGRSLRLLFRT
jgi:hypothetical protein